MSRCVLLQLAVAVLVSGGGGDDETARTLYKVMAMESWYGWANGCPMDAVAERWAAVVTTLVNPDGGPACLKPSVNETNAEAMVGAVYAALGCWWADSVVATLRSLDAAGAECRRRALHDVNRTVLKAESALFRLAELSPAVLAREPGPLSAAVSLNLRLNRAAAGDEDRARTAYEIAAAINTVERFTIGRCTAPVRPEPSADGGCLERTLNRTGLVAPDYHEYNVNDGRAPVRPSVVHRVTEDLRSLLGAPADEDPTFDYVDDVFRHQSAIYDSLRLVVHSYTLDYLAALDGPAASADGYLDETYVRNNDLVSCYRQLTVRAAVAEFPPDIVGHVQLMTRLVDSVLRFKTVRGLDVYRLHENERLARLRAQRPDDTVSAAVAERYTSTGRFELHKFLHDVLSVKHIKYYNDIFKLSKYDCQEVKDRHRVIDVKLKRFFVHVYARCFDIQFPSVSNRPMTRNVLDAKLVDIFKILKYIISYHNVIHPTVDLDVLIGAVQFLRYNQIKYSETHGYARDKLNRTLYMFTNYIDKYQIIHFETHTLRNDAYYMFKNNRKSEYFKDLDVLQRVDIDEDLELTNSEEKLKYCVLFNDIYNIPLDIRPSVNLFWKGELQNINNILDNVTRNLFDLYSISNYVQVFIEWITAVISYTLLDFIEYKLVGKTFPRLYTYIEKWNYYKWPEYCSAALKTVISKMKEINVSKFELIRMQSILENNLHEYSNAVQRYVNGQVTTELSAEQFAIRVNELNNLFLLIFHTDNMFTDKCFIIESKNVLIFYLPKYFYHG